MAAPPFGLTEEQTPLAETGRASASGSASAPVPAPAAPRELTLRALALGGGIGIVLAMGNVYTGLKTGFIDGGALTATLVSFTAFAALRRFGPRAFSPLENNIAQTVAASAAVMAFVHGLMGPIPALGLMGHAAFPAWALWSWGLALGVMGVLVAVWSRRKLIVEDALPLPSGGATSELIRTLHADRRVGVRPMVLLIAAAAFAAVTAWLRDGRAGLVPQAIYLPFAVAGLSASALTLGVAISPLMAATGIFIGLRGALGLFGAGVISWGILAPAIVRAHVVNDPSYTTLTGWLVWPAFGMMIGGSVGPLLADARRNGQVLRRLLDDAWSLIARLVRGGARAGAGVGHARRAGGR